MVNVSDNLSTSCLAFLGGVGWQEILIIVFVMLLLFGGKKLPELARGMGRGLRHFKEELHGVKKQIADAAEEPPQDVTTEDSSPEEKVTTETKSKD